MKDEELELRPGLSAEVSLQVSQGNLATDVRASSVPVLSTPAMIELMESAALAAVEDHLPPDQTCVGTRLDIRHLAATPAGLKVRALAELIEIDGRRLVFRVEAFDEVERIGAGQHERMLVPVEAFLERAAAKGQTTTG